MKASLIQDLIPDYKTEQEIRFKGVNPPLRKKESWIESANFRVGALENTLVIDKGEQSIVLEVAKISEQVEKEETEYMYSELTDIERIKTRRISIYHPDYEIGSYGTLCISNQGFARSKRGGRGPTGDLASYPWMVRTSGMTKYDGNDMKRNETIHLTEEQFEEVIDTIHKMAKKDSIKYDREEVDRI